MQRSELGQFSRLMEVWIDAMANGELPSIEGYIPLVEEKLIGPTLTSLAKIAKSWSCSNPTWSEDASRSEREGEYSLAEYIDLYQQNKLVMLSFDYERILDVATLSFRLLFYKLELGAEVNIVCYREAILDCPDRMAAITDALCEFQNLFDELSGNALFFGPDNADYPEDPQNYSKIWTKIAER